MGRRAAEELATEEETRLVEENVHQGNGLQLLTDLRTAYLAGGRSESSEAREQRMMAILERRKDEVTMTLLLMIEGSDDRIAYIVNNALLGMRYDANAERPIPGMAPPLHPVIELQSLRKSCAKCRAYAENEAAPRCERQGKYHDVVYKTGQKSGTGQEHRLITAMGGTVENNVLCEVDPETGRFSLPPLEAKKALMQWGENAVRATRRFIENDDRKVVGDRWKIREVAHYNLYANAVLSGALRKDVPAMTAD